MRNAIKYNDIIIGSSLTALSYAYINKIPILISYESQNIPFLYEYFTSDIDFGRLGFRYLVKIRKTNRNIDIGLGLQKIMLYDNLNISLSLIGLVPFGKCFNQLNVNIIKKNIEVITQDNIYYIEYKNLYIFETENIVWNLKPIENQEKQFLVVDYYNIKQLPKAEYNDYYDLDENNFVNEIIIDNHNVRYNTIFSISFLSKEQYNDTKYSDFFVRKKICNTIFQGNNIITKPGGREIRNFTKECYKNYNNIFFLEFSLEQFWKENTNKCQLLEHSQNFKLLKEIVIYNGKNISKKKNISFSRYYTG